MIASSKTGKEYKVGEVGLLTPTPHPCPALYPGQVKTVFFSKHCSLVPQKVGFITCSMRKATEAVLGDTLHQANHPVAPLLDIQPSKPMVYAGVYPFNAAEHKELKMALEKLCLNDSSVTVMVETSPALGQGWRLGFLGVLHMEVFTQRLDQEQQVQVVITAPSVPYRMKIGPLGPVELRGTDITASNPSEFLQRPQVAKNLAIQNLELSSGG